MSTLQLRTRAPGVAQVTMARPEVFNAFDEAMIGELDAAFAQLEHDAAVRVIVLAGEGRHFSAGADLQWMRRASQASRGWNLDDARRFAAMLARIDACPKPTVARVQGAALGGGVGLACACDIAVAAEALALALVQRVVPAGQLDAAVDAVVRDLLQGGPLAQREIKRLYAQFEVGPITPAVRELTAETIARVRGTDEAREGFAAFLGKRPAKWTLR